MRRLKANSRTHEGAEDVVKRSIPALVDSGAGKPKVGVLVLRALRLLPPDGLVLAVAPIVVVSGFGFRALHHHESPQPDVRDLPRVAAVPGVE